MAEVIELAQAIGKRLVIWSIVCITIGTIMILTSLGTFLGGIGVQDTIWGIID